MPLRLLSALLALVFLSSCATALKYDKILPPLPPFNKTFRTILVGCDGFKNPKAPTTRLTPPPDQEQAPTNKSVVMLAYLTGRTAQKFVVNYNATLRKTLFSSITIIANRVIVLSNKDKPYYYVWIAMLNEGCLVAKLTMPFLEYNRIIDIIGLEENKFKYNPPDRSM